MNTALIPGIRFGFRPWRAVVVLSVAVTAMSVCAGDKIIFSGSGEHYTSKPEVDDRRKELSSDRFVSRKSSVGAAIEMPMMPQSNGAISGGKRAQLMMKLFDRRENWIYNTADDLTGDPNVNEALGVRDYDLDNRESGRKRGMARYLDRSNPEKPRDVEAGTSSKETSESPEPREQVSTNRFASFGVAFGSAKKAGDDPNGIQDSAGNTDGFQTGGFIQFDNPFNRENNPFQQASTSERDEKFGKSLRSLISGANLDPDRSEAGSGSVADRKMEFRNLLNNGTGGLSLTSGADPINAFQNEPTRQPFNPMIGSGSGGIDFRGQSLGGGAGEPGGSGFRSSGLGRPGNLLDGLGSRPELGASSAPSATTLFNGPAATPQVQARPGMLEWPKRRF